MQSNQTFSQKDPSPIDLSKVESASIHNELDDLKSVENFYIQSKNKTLVLDSCSLFLFGKNSKIRQFCLKIICNSNFEYVIIAIIVGNSIVLALNDYKDFQNEGVKNQRLNFFGDIFTWLFFAESLIKIIALGFCLSPNSYFRDTWNIVDFLIAVSGVIEFVGNLKQNTGKEGGISVNFKALRVVRVIRPLKSINAMPSMRQLVSALISSLPELGNVTIFLGFVFILFGILGL